jgi:CPA2 family monovalent cation:H+ antiporter-2
VVICFAVAWLTASAGLSLALGAFLAGLIVSETEYSHQALGNILPFRDVFSCFFFISIGMLLDVGVLWQHLGFIALLFLSVLMLKSLLAGSAVILMGFPLRTAILAGLALFQVGEFSFILSKTGVNQGLLSGNAYQIFLDVTVLTLVATPFIMSLAPRLADLVLRLPLPERVKSGSYLMETIKVTAQKDHLIIVGLGVNGRNLARAAEAGGIPYVIIEMNPETVRQERQRGRPIYYGDGTQEEILHHANIQEARIVVVVINDPAATRRIINLARRLNSRVHIIVRTRYLQELQPLLELGADDVVPEEFETSVEIFTLVLKKYLVAKGEIERLITEVRANCYLIFRGLARELEPFGGMPHYLHDLEISTVRLNEEAPLAGKSLAQMHVRKTHGVTVLAIRRDSLTMTNPDPDLPLKANDLLVVMGSPLNLTKAAWLFENPPDSSA